MYQRLPHQCHHAFDPYERWDISCLILNTLEERRNRRWYTLALRVLSRMANSYRAMRSQTRTALTMADAGEAKAYKDSLRNTFNNLCDWAVWEYCEQDHTCKHRRDWGRADAIFDLLETKILDKDIVVDRKWVHKDWLNRDYLKCFYTLDNGEYVIQFFCDCDF